MELAAPSLLKLNSDKALPASDTTTMQRKANPNFRPTVNDPNIFPTPLFPAESLVFFKLKGTQTMPNCISTAPTAAMSLLQKKN
ncbi:hypothetical protein [Herbaspirillum sp. B65]|uniref:hypothetical protein n=1 Tax=Herbaspirillum sp. B65 TaxID=137708 RepID=UPI002091DF7C|nr:hypothetical protein [Herbaspirillum sp. B65]